MNKGKYCYNLNQGIRNNTDILSHCYFNNPYLRGHTHILKYLSPSLDSNVRRGVEWIHYRGRAVVSGLQPCSQTLWNNAPWGALYEVIPCATLLFTSHGKCSDFVTIHVVQNMAYSLQSYFSTTHIILKKQKKNKENL